ncbi:class I SAM-dependent methyltransferase [Sphingomonas psychrotolerans]|uniref:Class I SAM-dependent methyltransferase n=1 Tax=Sphingomonas psychrotolerans TaxID=1327635 RepID=A0ABU3N0L2_9SPHN|nr:class I SAM-dependent methyltransferase [Sphingomonas psychrotolerans]MDT8757307.1 class I SAM-dependent methyltransferase [Sphingomonas psychrotolerans]
MSKHDLFTTFTAAYPAQPATAFWRAIEIGALASRNIPQGLGLDLGCGDGLLTHILLERIGPRRLVGIDLDPLETEAARRFPFYERVLTCSADAIGEPDGSFDFVISNSVLEHVPPLEGTISEVGRLLKPGGRFFFTVPGPGFHDNLRGGLLPGSDRSAYLEELDRRLAHFHYLSRDDWAAMLGRHGLSLDSCLGYLDRTETRRWETLSRMTGGLLYSVFGQTSRPIEIQRKLGIRSMQNAGRLPAIFAAPLARVMRAGVDVDLCEPEWTDIEQASCLLIEGRRA